jgi:hypothetical protein
MELLQQVRRRGAAIVSISLALLWLAPSKLWSRLEVPPATVDLTPFTSTAPRIFRAVVRDVSAMQSHRRVFSAVVRLQVQRWYRGEGASDASLHYETSHFSGHNCIDFKPGTHWLIFATEENGYLKLVDDCYGAVAVSPMIAPALQSPDMLAQIEADLTAGLADSDRAGRLLSIQRLGGLKSASSRPALRSVIERGDATERNWATYAALRTGDMTILSRVRDMFRHGQKDVPPVFIAWELGQLRDRSAIPDLIEIVDTALDSSARGYALEALGRNIQASEALPTIAARLSDLDSGVRFYALDAMSVITHESACTLPMEPRWTDDMIEPQVRQCLAWWNDVGQQRFSRKQ